MALSHSRTFTVEADQFRLDGKPFRILSGEIHYQRIPRPYWRHRLQAARAMGLNAVAIYMFWNAHEPRPGEFDFSGGNDVAEFVRIAHESELLVILRPGPYCCAEWDFGGLPWWLLADGSLRVRCNDPAYIAAVQRYMKRWAAELAGLQCTKGGSIVLVQVENEYGSYGSDKEYLAAIRDGLQENGFDVPLFTCDGPGDDMFGGGTLPDVLTGVNFGSDPAGGFEKLRKFIGNKATPLLCPEFYTGWFVHWHNRDVFHKNPIKTKQVNHDLQWMLDAGASFSLYMFHGGTNFGFTAGANYFASYKPDITSYDYGAPLLENGQYNSDYHVYREMFAKHQHLGTVLPPVPQSPPVGTLPPIHFKSTTLLMDHLGAPRHEPQVRPMEMLGQQHGLILYRTRLIPAFSGKSVTIRDLHDYGHVFLDGARIATLERGRPDSRPEVFRMLGNLLCKNRQDPDMARFKLPAIPAGGATLDILVEAHGRVNYGARLLDRKGITEYVGIDDRIIFMNWDIYCLPLDQPFMDGLAFKEGVPEKWLAGTPAFHEASFTLAATDINDTYLDMTLWKKGMAWVNGHNLGRFWSVGPQDALYLPGCWLREGRNEIILLDMEGPQPGKVVEKVLKNAWFVSKDSIRAVNQARPPVRGKLAAKG
jgi:beta-galactosidase